MSVKTGTQNAAKEALNYDIAIVGGGMVGAALACGLAQGSNYRIALIENQPWQAMADLVATTGKNELQVGDFGMRVSALTEASRSLLEGLGAWDAIVARRACPYREMTVWDAEGTAQIHFDAADMHQPHLGHIVENRIIVAALYQQLKVQLEHKAVQLDGYFEASIDGVVFGTHGVSIKLANGQTLEAKACIAADGANSRMRAWSGLPTREWDYEHQAIICNVQTEQTHEFCARQRFLDSGPLAFLPMGSIDEPANFSSIVWSLTPDLAQEVLALDDSTFMTRLGDAFENRLGKIEAVSPRQSFPLRQRHAKQYVMPRFALIGDAAHTIHPLAGQGVNLGFLDVAALTNVLCLASEQNLDPGDVAILRQYQRKRMGGNLAMMGLMETFKRLFAEDHVAIRWARNTGMRWLNDQGLLKKQVAELAMGL